MPINQKVIENSIPHHHRTHFLKEDIKLQTGDFASQRSYLQRWRIVRSIQSLVSCKANAFVLAEYMSQCIESAHDRGVFVTCSRVLSKPDLKGDCVESLVNELRRSEFECFDAISWYGKNSFDGELRKKGLCEDSIRELSPYLLRHVRAAFTHGIKQTATILLDPHVLPF